MQPLQFTHLSTPAFSPRPPAFLTCKPQDLLEETGKEGGLALGQRLWPRRRAWPQNQPGVQIPLQPAGAPLGAELGLKQVPDRGEGLQQPRCIGG